MDVKPLLAELKARVVEELDYLLEAGWQRAFAEAYDGDPDIVVPKVIDGSGRVLVTEWLEGTPLSAIIRDGSQADRDRAGSCSSGSCTPVRPGRPAARRPHPETSGCWPTGGSACSTSVRSTGFRPACPSPPDGSRGSRWR